MNPEEIKAKKMQELQQEQMQMQQQIATLDTLAKQYLTTDALSRYGSIKAAHPEKALQVMLVIAQSAQQGRLKEKLTDAQLKELLRGMEKPKKEFRITRK